jgi:hypothetical protein
LYTVFSDDSGSSPEHKVVVACGIVVPTIKIVRMNSEWNRFLEKEGIRDFHTSVCVARNPRSDFANWDDARVQRVFARVRQITLRYSVRGFCILIYKQDYEGIVPRDMRDRIGSYYTWALSSVLGLAHDYGLARSAAMKYVFDTAEKEIKREIDDAMEYMELRFPGDFADYSFGNRREVPGLQAVDLFAWTCFQQGKRARVGQTIHKLGHESWNDYSKALNGEWAVAQSLNREGLEKWVRETYGGPEDRGLKDFKEKQLQARKFKPKGKVAK